MTTNDSLVGTTTNDEIRNPKAVAVAAGPAPKTGGPISRWTGRLADYTLRDSAEVPAARKPGKVLHSTTSKCRGEGTQVMTRAELEALFQADLDNELQGKAHEGSYCLQCVLSRKDKPAAKSDAGRTASPGIPDSRRFRWSASSAPAPLWDCRSPARRPVR